MRRAWIVILCLFFLIATIQAMVSPPVPNTVRVEFTAKDQGSLFQAFFKIGRAFNENDSKRTYYPVSEKLQTIFFAIPKGAIQRIRLDPLSNPGDIGLKSIAVGYRPLVFFGPMVVGHVWPAADIVSTFKASRDIGLFHQEGGFARILSVGNDPQLISHRDAAFIAAWVSPLKIGFLDAALVGAAKLLALACAVVLAFSLLKSFKKIALGLKTSCLNSSSGYLSACAIYTIAFCAAHFRLIFTEQMPIWDAQQYFHPYYVLLADYLRSGYLLLWNPYAAGGVPAYVDPQMAAFSPLILLFGLITGGSTGGYIFYWLFLLWFGGAGMILLAKNMGAPLWGAVLAALGFSLSGFHTGHSEHLSWLYTASFLPYVIYFVSKGIAENRIMHSAIGGVTLGIAGLGGYPGIVIHMCMYSIVWMTVYSLLGTGKRQRWNAFPLLVHVSIFTVLSVVVMSPTYFGFFYDGIGLNSRIGSLSKEMAQTNPFSPGALISLISPIFPVLKFTNNLWPDTDISSASIYVGSLTIILAVLSAFSQQKRGFLVATASLSLVVLAIAMGGATPLRGLLYDVFPPSRYTRHPSLFRIFFIFGIVYLSLYGSVVLQKLIVERAASQPGLEKSRLRYAYSCVIMTCIAACISYLLFMHISISAPFQYHIAHTLLLVSWGGPLLLALLLSGCRRSLLQALPAILIVIAVADALLNITISTPVISQSALRFIVPNHTIDLTTKRLYREAGSIINYNFLTKIPGFIAYCPINSRNFFYNRISSNAGLLNLSTSGDRIWLCENAVTIAPSEQNYLFLEQSPDFLDKFKCVVHSDEMMLGKFANSQDDQPALTSFKPSIVRLSPTVARYVPGRVEFSVYSPADGYLVITDRWARSWRALVNGRQEKVLGGSFIFLSLKISKGENHVELVYDPKYTKYFLALSYVVSVITGILAVGCCLWKTK